VKELVIRAISGLLYIALIIGSLYWSEHIFYLVFFVLGLICLGEFKKLTKLASIFPIIIYITLFFFLVAGNFQHELGTNLILAVSILVNMYLILDLFKVSSKPSSIPKKYLLTSFYLSSGISFLCLIPTFNHQFTPLIILGVFILIWTNDSFAFIVGKLFGKHKLFERISPKKTIEGFLGGLVFSCIASYFIANFTETLSVCSWLIISIIIGVFGAIGDLIQSKFKRAAAVKDSGNIMPGHGGMYDRLDSIIFSAPFIYLFLQILVYVS
jgi:phosphatidate cytidylyltransferase